MQPSIVSKDLRILEQLEGQCTHEETVGHINALTTKLQKVSCALFDKQYSMEKRMGDEERKMDKYESKVLFLTKENQKLRSDLTLLKGIIRRQHRQIDSLSNRVVDLTARGMANNLIFTGIKEERNENCEQVLLDFLSKKLEYVIDANNILAVHRLGKSRNGIYRPLIAKFPTKIKSNIMDKAKK